MTQVTRSWLAFASMGAGVIHLALVSDTGIPTAFVLVVLGGAEFGWGVCVLARDRLVLPRVTGVAAFAPALGWGVLLLAAVVLEEPALASPLTVFPMAVSVLFTLAIAAVLGGVRRRAGRDPSTATAATSAGGAEVAGSEKLAGDIRPRGPSHPYRYLAGLFAGALAVSALTTPALAATGAGEHSPHAHHAEFTIPTHHPGH